MPQLHITPRKDTVPIAQEVGWVSAPLCTGAENIAPYSHPGFDPRNVQRVGSRYNNWAIQPTCPIHKRIEILKEWNYNNLLHLAVT
jgi:hypothetical protein